MQFILMLYEIDGSAGEFFFFFLFWQWIAFSIYKESPAINLRAALQDRDRILLQISHIEKYPWEN